MQQPQKITFAELGDLLQSAWKNGKIGTSVYDLIMAGYLPINYLREKLRWVIERSDEEGYLNLTQY